MSYPFKDKMDNEISIFNTEKRKASLQANMVKTEKQEGAMGKKRPASETLEHDSIKVAKIAAADDDEGVATGQIEQALDPKDEKIAKLKSKLGDAKIEISRLEKQVVGLEEEVAEYGLRVHELEARENKRIEKEQLVQTDMHSVMKLASINYNADVKAKHAKKEKDLKERLKEDKDNYAFKLETTWKKKLDDANTKAKKREKDIQDKLNQAKEDHKEEIQTLKEEQKEALKGLRPEHSQAMKEKAKELKAKDKAIADLQKRMEGMKTLKVDKERLEGEVKASEAKNSGLRDYIKHEQSKWKAAEVEWKTKEDQYNSKLEHEGRRWELQNQNATEATNRLMVLQRSNFAMRADRDAKNNRIRELESAAQITHGQSQDPTRLMLQQRATFTPNIDDDSDESQVQALGGDLQAAQMQSSNEGTCIQNSIDMKELDATAVREDDEEASAMKHPSILTPVAMESTLQDIVEASDGSYKVE